MRKVVIQIMIFLVFVGSSSAANYATEVASDRPVTWIRFEGNVKDHGSAGNDGLVTSESGYAYGSGFTTTGGDSLGNNFSNINSSSSYVDLGNGLLNDLRGARAITIEFWIDTSNITAFSSGAAIFATSSSGTSAAAINVDDAGSGRITVSGRSKNDDPFISRAAKNLGFEDFGAKKLLHIVGIYDFSDITNNPSIKLWVNGRKIELDNAPAAGQFGSDRMAVEPGQYSTWIGRNQSNQASTALPIDEVAFYDYALSEERIRAHYYAEP